MKSIIYVNLSTLPFEKRYFTSKNDISKNGSIKDSTGLFSTIKSFNKNYYLSEYEREVGIDYAAKRFFDQDVYVSEFSLDSNQTFFLNPSNKKSSMILEEYIKRMSKEKLVGFISPRKYLLDIVREYAKNDKISHVILELNNISDFNIFAAIFTKDVNKKTKKDATFNMYELISYNDARVMDAVANDEKTQKYEIIRKKCIDLFSGILIAKSFSESTKDDPFISNFIGDLGMQSLLIFDTEAVSIKNQYKISKEEAKDRQLKWEMENFFCFDEKLKYAD
jgi:hypothetical protein